MTSKSTSRAPQGPRRDHPARRVEPKQHDTYKARSKPVGTTVCPACGVVLRAGKWSWTTPAGDARKGTCPACRRIHNGYPAGTIELLGEGIAPYRIEIGRPIRSIEAREKAEHPLERLMTMKVEPDGLRIETTGLHLARSIASAVKRRFHGHVQITYPEGENRVRVTWVLETRKSRRL